jgi:hypothetical protein
MTARSIRLGLAISAVAILTAVGADSGSAAVGLNPPTCTPAYVNHQGDPNGQTGAKDCPSCDPITGICQITG